MPPLLRFTGDQLDAASARPGRCRRTTGPRFSKPFPATPPPRSEQRDELAALHSITSSATAKTAGGIVETERFGGLQVDHQLEFRWLASQASPPGFRP